MLFENFTYDLINELSKGTPINLICAKENQLACDQFLEELTQFFQNKSIKINKLDIKTYKNNFTGFFDKIENFLQENQQDKICLILKRFEELFNSLNIDNGFNKQFLDHLNSLKNQGIGLICVSTETYKNKLLYVEKEQVHLSLLELREKLFPNLNSESLKKLLQQKSLKLRANEFEELFDFYKNNYKRFDLLDLILNKLQNQQDIDLIFAKRLKIWKTDFLKTHSSFNQKGWFQAIDSINHYLKVILLTKQRLKPVQKELEKLSIWRLSWSWMMDKFKGDKK